MDLFEYARELNKDKDENKKILKEYEDELGY